MPSRTPPDSTTSTEIPYAVRRALAAWRTSLGDRVLTAEEQAVLDAMALSDEEIQRQSILLALADTGSSRDDAAQRLGVSRRTLFMRLNALDMHREVEEQAQRLGHPTATGATPAAYPRTGPRHTARA